MKNFNYSPPAQKAQPFGFRRTSQGKGSDAGIVVASVSLAVLLKGGTIVASDGSTIRGRLHIPEYQRPYRWGEAVFSRLLSDLRDFFAPPKKAAALIHPFYLGSIVLHQKIDAETGKPRLDIIDGQQRLTSMALLAYQLGESRLHSDLKFSAPESQNQILTNLRWLEMEAERIALPEIDFNRINVTLVVTRSEDDAYRFFETQNTGGVRLKGPDIIKAHHLRAIDSARRDDFAKSWEKMQPLNSLIDSIMKIRHWQSLRWRDIATHRDPGAVRGEIVEELAEKTGKEDSDLVYRQVVLDRNNDRGSLRILLQGYSIRQPLTAGINAIHFFEHLYKLHAILFPAKNHIVDSDVELEYLPAFHDVYRDLIVKANGSAYLKQLYDSAVLFYASKFGLNEIFEAGLQLFRVIFSPRLSNEKMVRESTAQSFARETSVLDWIESSFSHAQLMQFLTKFDYVVDANNLEGNSVKAHFFNSVQAYFTLPLSGSMEKKAAAYDSALKVAIITAMGKNREGIKK